MAFELEFDDNSLKCCGPFGAPPLFLLQRSPPSCGYMRRILTGIRVHSFCKRHRKNFRATSMQASEAGVEWTIPVYGRSTLVVPPRAL